MESLFYEINNINNLIKSQNIDFDKINSKIFDF